MTIAYRHFHEQLDDLRARLLAMGERAEALVELAVDALLERDLDRADLVIAGDRALDLDDIAVEATAVQLLALQQPMARDLRFLVGAIKVASDLERVGDHAVNIAESVCRLAEHAAALEAESLASGVLDHAATVTVLRVPALEDMARRAPRLLADALDAFTRGDGALGRAVTRADDEIDALYGTVFRSLRTQMITDSRAVPAALELLLVSRNLERVADLATNIGEDAVYVAEGRQIRHQAKLLPAEESAA